MNSSSSHTSYVFIAEISLFCNRDVDFWMAVCYPCFPGAQITGKLHILEDDAENSITVYKEIILKYAMLMVMSKVILFALWCILYYSEVPISNVMILFFFLGGLETIYMSIVLRRARIRARRLIQMHANDAADTIYSCCCIPCVITQL